MSSPLIFHVIAFHTEYDIFIVISSFYFSLEGYLFDKEAILEYYLAKKKEISRKLKEYEKQKKREENEINELKAAAHRSQVEKFIGKTER